MRLQGLHFRAVLQAPSSPADSALATLYLQEAAIGGLHCSIGASVLVKRQTHWAMGSECHVKLVFGKVTKDLRGRRVARKASPFQPESRPPLFDGSVLGSLMDDQSL